MSSGPAKKALLVEHDPKWMQFLRASLLEAGYDPTEAYNMQMAGSIRGRYDAFVIGSDVPITPGGDPKVPGSSELYKLLRSNHGGTNRWVVTSRGTNLKLEGECDADGVKFLDLGTGSMPSYDGLEEMVSYLRQ